MPMNFSKPLKNGATIGIVAPASAGDPDILAKGRRVLEEHGYRVVIHPQCYQRIGQLAGTDEDRASALMAMFRDPAIDAIMCARGGNGSIRLLDKLDYPLIKQNPKPFIGYSDITLFLQAISKNCGFVTYHGPMLASFGRDFDPRTADDFFAHIESERGLSRLAVPDVDILVSGEAEGVLVGGNMTLLQNMVGTAYDWSGRDAILFLEDVDEVLYRIDRTLQHFRLAGKFQNIRAVIFGDMIDVPDDETSHMREGERPYGRNIRQILEDNLPPNIPVCMNFPCGHGKHITTLPIGASVKLALGKHGAVMTPS